MDQGSPLLPGTPAPYGRSCANCAQSKRKCIVRGAGEPCERIRCHKTNRDCMPAKTVRRRNSKRPVASKANRLEAKIDSLVSLMQAGTSPADLPLANIVDHSVSVDVGQENTPVRNSDDDSVLNCLGKNQNNTPATTPAASDSAAPSNLGEPSLLEAEEYLTHFQTSKLQYFPFLYIPFTTSAESLRRRRPFLWHCIMAISSKSSAQQQSWGNRVRQTIAQEMVVRSEKSLDLLLGLLAFVGWANYQVHSKPFLAVFTQLAVSLVFDLGLNKPLPDEASMAFGPKQCRTMEERRAVLGCFLVTSVISSFLHKIDALRWTPHLDECLELLDKQKECLNDDILVQQVRLQLVVETVTQDSLHSRHFRWIERAETPSNFFSELAHIKTIIFNTSPKNVTFLHLYSVELEVALSGISLRSNDLTISERENLYLALTSINSWFDVFLTIPPSGYVGFSFSTFSQLVRCLTTLYRLATLDVPMWDKMHVRKTANPLSILNQIVTNLEQVPGIAGMDNRDNADGDVFSRSAQIFRSLRPEWEARVGVDDVIPATMPSSQDAGEIPSPGSFGDEILDNDWFMDLLSSNVIPG
ncbi:hypothetical protein N7462_001482 [Penicillium macrosclerotiorum]|uniref:uncharacterized protein n=1 Tax=Penicillium macrosclerotiorum TaxID=303699 RepID=UPI0025483423|nr:uncharacterized protein N7462_001482 [Penicillium macrosclerotiorum]KAJ5692059.1 hypothetical protein N7462_001482 [Penicillium macrosclerotiorum]